MRENQDFSQVDARVISLYSQDTDATPLWADPPHQHEMLEYFNVMDIFPSNGTDPLLDAYQLSRGHGEGPNSSRQVLLAFADVAGTSRGATFTRDEITAFWDDLSEPLLFATLLNVEDAERLPLVVERIRRQYAKDKYLIYFTLDYCEAIVFLKCDSFHHCAELVFSLDYGLEEEDREKSAGSAPGAKSTLLANSLTLYSLVNGFDFGNPNFEPKERFGVYLRFGMSDAQGVQEFCEKLKALTRKQSGVELSENWILGRYDVGVYHPRADLRWVVSAKQLLKQANQPPENEDAPRPWYTSHTFSVLIPPAHLSLKGHIVSHNSDNTELGQRMKTECGEFEAAYRNACRRLEIPPDEVFLRWLHKASAQAVSFWGSNVMTDLGVCLVSQFLDFFTYAKRLWSSENLTNSKREQAEVCFSTFFSNISILVDGMNHSSRQFILTPPFRTIAFEMPPKVMAYYTAVTHRLIDVFNDNSQNEHYGFIISPKFARELDVRSLVPEDCAGENEFIAIGVGEEWLYRLQHTTAVLAHEISHFVGSKGRERPFRKSCVLRAEIQSILVELADGLHETIIRHYRDTAARLGAEQKLPEAFPEEGRLYISKRSLEQEAEKLLDILCRCDGLYRSETDYVYRRDLILLLRKAPYYFHGDLLLQSEIFNFLWQALISNENGTTNLGRAVAWVESFYAGMDPAAGLPAKPDYASILDAFAKRRIQAMFQELLESYANDYAFPLPDQSSRMQQACDHFSEAYADLQAILLFNLSWDEYCGLFGHLGDTLPGIVRPRLLAMRMVLFAEDARRPSKEQSDFSRAVRQIEELADRLRGLSPDGSGGDLEIWYRELQLEGVDPSTFRYLIKYLLRCRRSIEDHFRQCGEKKRALEDIYGQVSSQTGAYKLFHSMMRFIADYRKDIQGSPRDGAPSD